MNKKNLLFLALLCTFFTATAQKDSLKMNQLQVPDGFNYLNYQNIVLDLELQDLERTSYIYQIKGVDNKGKSHLIAQNFLPKNRQLQQEVRLALHFERVQLVLQAEGDEHLFEWEKRPYIHAILSPNNQFLSVDQF